MISPYDLLGLQIHSKKISKEKFKTHLTPMEVFIDNEARNTKNTHLSKPYLQTWKNNDICGNQKLQNTLLPMPLVVT
jgi:hypothetical protein